MAEQIVFFIFTLLVLGGGVGVVVTKNLYYAALYLCLSLTGMAGYFIMLNAGFLAAVQVVVYIGAIAILILFAIMLSRKIMTTREPQSNRQSIPAAITALLLYLGFTFIALTVDWPVSETVPAANGLLQLGLHFLGGYVIPFEVISVLLLVALIGAIILARDTGTE